MELQQTLLRIAVVALTFVPSIYGMTQATENDAILCADGIDNDGDGLVDCQDPDCSNLPNDGCLTCGEGISFADTVLSYTPGCPVVDPDPTGALGVSDVWNTAGDFPEFVFLGEGGEIKLGFLNNLLTNSGDAQADLWVFEIGSQVEASDIALRPFDTFTTSQLQLAGILDADSDGYYEIGGIAGSTSSLDLDAIIPGVSPNLLRFDAVEITDVANIACAGNTPGADIDAVCALSTIPSNVANDLEAKPSVRVFPNPSSGGNVNISFGAREYQVLLKLRDMLGKIVLQQEFTNVEKVIVDLDEVSGPLMLSLEYADGRSYSTQLLLTSNSR